MLAYDITDTALRFFFLSEALKVNTIALKTHNVTVDSARLSVPNLGVRGTNREHSGGRTAPPTQRRYPPPAYGTPWWATVQRARDGSSDSMTRTHPAASLTASALLGGISAAFVRGSLT